jgi:hypothetical protein
MSDFEGMDPLRELREERHSSLGVFCVAVAHDDINVANLLAAAFRYAKH